MSKIIHRTRTNPSDRGSKKRLATKSPLTEPPQPMGWEPNTPIRQKSNTTPGNRQNKQQTSTKHKQALKNGQDHKQEYTGIQQKQNDKTISPSTIGQPLTSNIQSSYSDSDSEDK